MIGPKPFVFLEEFFPLIQWAVQGVVATGKCGLWIYVTVLLYIRSCLESFRKSLQSDDLSFCLNLHVHFVAIVNFQFVSILFRLLFIRLEPLKLPCEPDLAIFFILFRHSLSL